ncbi:MAG: hypothetical protein PHC34_04350 [Candidatus Gastranaerophilales bacterium]|nr:hypothetical protein [Candidatus Gastranaerophilales bacterium]
MKIVNNLLQLNNSTIVKNNSQNISFTGNPNNGSGEDMFVYTASDADLDKRLESNKKLLKLYYDALESFPYHVKEEQIGTRVKIPNCIMVLGNNSKITGGVIEWMKNYSGDSNIVNLANEDKDVLQDDLWDVFNKSKEEFLKTKKRTLIHVEGFDRLINPEINEFKNIEWLKDLMNRCASDFGVTIVFDTKDASKLTEEAIQPHRIGEILKTGDVLPSEFLEYDRSVNNKARIENYFKMNQELYPETSKPEIPKPQEEIQVKSRTTKSQEPKEQVKIEDEKIKIEPEAQTKVDTPEIKVEKEVKTENLDQGIKKASKGAKVFKWVAILAAIGGIIAGVRHLISKDKSKSGQPLINNNELQPTTTNTILNNKMLK